MTRHLQESEAPSGGRATQLLAGRAVAAAARNTVDGRDGPYRGGLNGSFRSFNGVFLF